MVTTNRSCRAVLPWRLGLFVAAVGLVGQAAPALADEAAKIDSGDTAWMLTSSALVLMMTAPGLALFYGGLVRSKNTLSILMQSFIMMALI
ncbi:MAG: ammonium transporter, partial [Deltaproteobacteria bacterium]